MASDSAQLAAEGTAVLLQAGEYWKIEGKKSYDMVSNVVWLSELGHEC